MKDKVFQDKELAAQDFQFTPQVAEVFDDMLERSVPFYKETVGMVASLLEHFVDKHERVYDLGCSTGATLIELSRKLAHLDLHYTGVDNSAAMISKASLKAEMYTCSDKIQFVEADILEFTPEGPSAIIMNYTLQFVRPLLRQDYISKLYDVLKPGGVLVISEKTICHDPILNRSFIKFYLDFKRHQGYSEIEITKKREALENVLVPCSAEENLKMLQTAGFKGVEQYFQWFNFACFIAVK